VRKFVVLACLVLCVALVGCSGNPFSQLPWAVNIYSYDLASQVETDRGRETLPEPTGMG